jgi:hypothetical protein
LEDQDRNEQTRHEPSCREREIIKHTSIDAIPVARPDTLSS